MVPVDARRLSLLAHPPLLQRFLPKHTHLLRFVPLNLMVPLMLLVPILLASMTRWSGGRDVSQEFHEKIPAVVERGAQQPLCPPRNSYRENATCLQVSRGIQFTGGDEKLVPVRKASENGFVP